MSPKQLPGWETPSLAHVVEHPHELSSKVSPWAVEQMAKDFCDTLSGKDEGIQTHYTSPIHLPPSPYYNTAWHEADSDHFLIKH